MSSNKNHFAEFRGHTRLKHFILRAYLAAWASKLLQGRNRHVLFVDAFAGEGKDRVGNDGSPLIAAKIASQVSESRNPTVSPAPQVVKLFAIDIDGPTVEQLRECLAPFPPGHPGHVEVRHGVLADFIDETVAAGQGCASLYFLDPFGIKGLEASTYPKALQGPQDEIFAIFADAKTPRLYGLVMAEAFDLESRLEEIRESPSLFEELDEASELEARQAAAAHQLALDVSQPAARAALSRALGGSDWQRALEGSAPEKRPGIFLQLFIDQLVRAGARFIMTMPMREEGGKVGYTLVHASKSEVGLMTMKESVSSGLNRTDLLPPAVVDLIRSDLSVPMGEIYDFLRVHFAGQEVSWADVARPALLVGTGVFHLQLGGIKNELKTGGWLVRGTDRKEYCRVPLT